MDWFSAAIVSALGLSAQALVFQRLQEALSDQYLYDLRLAGRDRRFGGSFPSLRRSRWHRPQYHPADFNWNPQE